MRYSSPERFSHDQTFDARITKSNVVRRGAMAILKHPIFMNDFTLEPKIPDVVREIKAQEASVRRVTRRLVKVEEEGEERKDSGLGNKSVSTKESE